MNYGYIRVDSVDGSTKWDKLIQEANIKKYCQAEGIDLDDCICEDCSTITPVDLRHLGRLLSKMSPGDRLICNAPRHLSYNTKELKALLKQCQKNGLDITILSELPRK